MAVAIHKFIIFTVIFVILEIKGYQLYRKELKTHNYDDPFARATLLLGITIYFQVSFMLFDMCNYQFVW